MGLTKNTAPFKEPHFKSEYVDQPIYFGGLNLIEWYYRWTF